VGRFRPVSHSIACLLILYINEWGGFGQSAIPIAFPSPLVYRYFFVQPSYWFDWLPCWSSRAQKLTMQVPVDSEDETEDDERMALLAHNRDVRCCTPKKFALQIFFCPFVVYIYIYMLP